MSSPTLIVRSPLALQMLAPGDGVFLPVFEDERPLRGLAGLVDWRLHGQLSRTLVSGHISGKKGEVCLVPSQGYVDAEHLLLVGLGSRKQMAMATLQAHMLIASRSLLEMGLDSQVFPVSRELESAMPVEAWADVFLSILYSSTARPLTLKILGGSDFAQSMKEVFRLVAAAALSEGQINLN